MQEVARAVLREYLGGGPRGLICDPGRPGRWGSMGRGPAKIARLETYPLDMTDGQLRAALGGLPDSELMRSLIMAEVAAIRGGAERETRTMRGLWYDFVKPVLSRAGRLGDKTRGGQRCRLARRSCQCT